MGAQVVVEFLERNCASLQPTWVTNLISHHCILSCKLGLETMLKTGALKMLRVHSNVLILSRPNPSNAALPTDSAGPSRRELLVLHRKVVPALLCKCLVRAAIINYSQERNNGRSSLEKYLFEQGTLSFLCKNEQCQGKGYSLASHSLRHNRGISTPLQKNDFISLGDISGFANAISFGVSLLRISRNTPFARTHFVLDRSSPLTLAL